MYDKEVAVISAMSALILCNYNKNLFRQSVSNFDEATHIEHLYMRNSIRDITLYSNTHKMVRTEKKRRLLSYV